MRRLGLSNNTSDTPWGTSRGFTLIEVLVALALFAIIAITFAGGLATASRAVFTGDVRTNAESLARTEMEYVKSQDYSSGPWAYTVTYLASTCTPPCPTWFTSGRKLSDKYAGYTASVQAVELDDGIQRITVTVSHEGRQVITLEGYKVSR